MQPYGNILYFLCKNKKIIEKVFCHLKSTYDIYPNMKKAKKIFI